MMATKRERARERARDRRAPCQGTDELIVETGISTFPCQCAPCHDTGLTKQEGRGKGRTHTQLYANTWAWAHTHRAYAELWCKENMGLWYLRLWLLPWLHCCFLVLSAGWYTPGLQSAPKRKHFAPQNLRQCEQICYHVQPGITYNEKSLQNLLKVGYQCIFIWVNTFSWHYIVEFHLLQRQARC